MRGLPSANWRFCGLWASNAHDAVRFFDDFYKAKGHSDIPGWAVIGAYNDRQCTESNVTPRLQKMQAKFKCGRVLVNMGSVSPEAWKAQKTQCDKLPAP